MMKNILFLITVVGELGLLILSVCSIVSAMNNQSDIVFGGPLGPQGFLSSSNTENILIPILMLIGSLFTLFTTSVLWILSNFKR